MNPALLQKGSNSFRTDSEIKDHEGNMLIFCVSPYCVICIYKDMYCDITTVPYAHTSDVTFSKF